MLHVARAGNTHLGRAHVEFMDLNLESVAKAKGELFAALKPENTAVINLDDPKIQKLPTQANKITFVSGETPRKVLNSDLDLISNSCR